MAKILETLRTSAAHIAQGDEPDQLVPDTKILGEFGITAMTLWRWTNDRTLGFPQPAKIRGKNYRSRRELERFKREGLARAIAEREPAETAKTIIA
jgi:hypothetical protein